MYDRPEDVQNFWLQNEPKNEKEAEEFCDANLFHELTDYEYIERLLLNQTTTVEIRDGVIPIKHLCKGINFIY